jgi:hypothetical protein
VAIANGIDLVAGLLYDPNHQFAEDLVIVDHEYPGVLVHSTDLLACGSDARLSQTGLLRNPRRRLEAAPLLPRPYRRDAVHVTPAVNFGVDHFDGCPDWVGATLPVAQEEGAGTYDDSIRMGLGEGRNNHAARWLATAGRVHLGREATRG